VFLLQPKRRETHNAPCFQQPALAVADVGVSMGEGVGTALAMEMSDVTLMDSNLQKLEYVLNMGTRVVFTIQENICMSLACKVLVVVLTFAGYMTLLYAIVSDVGVMLLVTLNGMKLLPGRADGALARRSLLKQQRQQRQRRLLFRPLVTYDQVPREGGQSNHDDSVSASADDDAVMGPSAELV
jgi:magnesium-transporting ATPase (P-type)